MSTDVVPATEKNEASASSSEEFLSKEALTSGARFKRDEGTLHVPELGGNLRVRAISFKEQKQIQAQMPDTLSGMKIKHTALVMSRYVVRPVLSQDEWEAVLSNPKLPAKAITRLNVKISEIMDVTEEEETAIADEFPGAED